MTLKSAKRLIWNGKDGIKAWDLKFHLGLDFNNAECVATFPNGSKIEVFGFETRADIDKIRGLALDLVVLDECKSFPISFFDELVEEAILPALTDKAGTLVIGGTPGSVLSGRFYEATADTQIKKNEDGEGRSAQSRPYSERHLPIWDGVEFTWSYHTWEISDNTAYRVKLRDGRTISIWEQCLRDQKKWRWSADDPRWRREYLGQWVADDQANVYAYDPTRNGWDPEETKKRPDANHMGLPNGHAWHYAMGIDLGSDNLTAIEVIAWCDDLPHFWQVYEDEAGRVTARMIAQMVKRAVDEVGPMDFIVADTGGLGVTVIDSIEEEYGLGIMPAKKSDKHAHIEVLNSELRQGRCFIIKNKRLADEMSTLTWDLPRGMATLARKEGSPLIKRAEDRSLAKDHCDAFLYVARQALHKFAKERAPEPEKDSPQWIAERRAAEWANVQGMMKKQNQYDTWGENMRMDGFGEDSTW